MKNSEILRLQYAAGLVLQQICALLQVSREDFSSTFAMFLGKRAKKGKPSEEGETKKEKPEGGELTVLSYFQKLPQKYFVRDDDFEMFVMALENVVYALCDGDNCTIDGTAVGRNWEKHRNEILHQLNRIHEKASDICAKTAVESTRQKIEDLIAN